MPSPNSIFGKATDRESMSKAADAAASMARTIRDWLPVDGELESKSTPDTIDDEFSEAGRSYTQFERVRNPRQMAWPDSHSSFFTKGPEGAAVAYRQLCAAMKEIAEHYGWQGISDGSTLPHSDVRGGRIIPPIPLQLLLRVEKAAAGLSHILATVPSDTTPPAGYLSYSDLAKKHGVDPGRLRGRLNTWRMDHDSGYFQVTNRKSRDPQFLYDETAVMSIIVALKSTANPQRKKSRP